jgi:hypothetical protein
MLTDRLVMHTPLVVRAPSAAQRAVAGDLGRRCWAGSLDLDMVAKRDAATWSCAYLARCLDFVLVPAEDEETVDILCAAKLFPVSLLVCQKGSSELADELRAFMVDSVIVPPVQRGNGCELALVQQYIGLIAADATIMAIKLYEHFLADKGQIAALLGFSDCGTRIWEPIGRAAPSLQTAWSVDDLAPIIVEANRHLSLEQALDLVDARGRQAALKLARCDPSKTRICVRPSRDIIEASLLHARENLRHRRGDRYVSSRVGVRFDDATYALWTYNAGEDALVMIRLEAADLHGLRLLLRAAANEARWHGVSRIIAWDIDEALLDADARTTERNFNVPIVAWLAVASAVKDVEWRFVERFAVVLESQ